MQSSTTWAFKPSPHSSDRKYTRTRTNLADRCRSERMGEVKAAEELISGHIQLPRQHLRYMARGHRGHVVVEFPAGGGSLRLGSRAQTRHGDDCLARKITPITGWLRWASKTLNRSQPYRLASTQWPLVVCTQEQTRQVAARSIGSNKQISANNKNLLLGIFMRNYNVAPGGHKTRRQLLSLVCGKKLTPASGGISWA